jgi:acetamidase/formamidase
VPNSPEDHQVRPTKRSLDDLGLAFPDIAEPLSGFDHPLIQKAQGTPATVEAGGAEPVRSLSDRIWFKCKIADLRGIVARLTSAEREACGLPPEVPWWIGAAGVRRDDSANDFYKLIEAEAIREGKGTGRPSTDHLLPQQVDRERLEAETATLLVQGLRDLVLSLIAASLKDGSPYYAEVTGHRVTAVVRASEDATEAYLAITAEGFSDPRVLGIILSAVPGIDKDDWLPEPGGAAGIDPNPGQIIWSTIIPPAVQANILTRAERNTSLRLALSQLRGDIHLLPPDPGGTTPPMSLRSAVLEISGEDHDVRRASRAELEGTVQGEQASSRRSGIVALDQSGEDRCMTRHQLDPSPSTTVDVFSRDLRPVLTVDPGDTIVLRSLNAAGYLQRLTFPGEKVPMMLSERRGHCLTGPIAVRGAVPGDVLAVRFISLRPDNWGYTVAAARDTPLTRRLGLHEGPPAWLLWQIDAEARVATSDRGHTVRIAPFHGVTGVAWDEPGEHSTIPPRAVGGGNIDCKELVAGSILYLPVAVPGVLLSIGDGHAAQGDGEVAGTAIECGMTTELQLDLVTGRPVPGVHAETPAGQVTFGFSPDLNAAMGDALDAMLTWLQASYGVGKATALALASPVLDPRITQVANQSWGVHALLPAGAIS